MAVNKEQAEQHRKNFIIGLAVIGGAIALASLSATYSINLESFKDWGKIGWLLAFLTAAGVEVTFCLVIYGIGYALVGWLEKALGVVALAFLIGVMATNFVIHRQVINQIPLSAWQQDYYDWIGATTLFGILILIVLFETFSHEAKERRQQREIDTIIRQRTFAWKKEVLQSDEFRDALSSHKQAVFNEAKKVLQLPSSSTTKTQPGFARTDNDPKS